MDKKDYTNKMGVVLNEKYIGWHGSTPFVEFDENFVQMPLTRTELKIPREHTTRMTYLAWYSGFIAGARGESGLKMLIILGVLLSVGTLIALLYLNSGTSDGLKALGEQVETMVSQIDIITTALNITTNVTAVV